ncbi:MAG: response regulator [Akkermansiaceae bacterium]|nr:response regulator [Verrucomicrobiales bacterium]
MNRKKILVVDDNEVILRTLSLKLKADYEVITAIDGSEAVAAARTKNPDLILLDIGFPPEVSGVPWDGFRIIQWLKRMDEAKNIPVIIITGGDASKYKDRALAEGAVAFYQKPVNNDDLLAKIREILSAAPATPAATPATPVLKLA